MYIIGTRNEDGTPNFCVITWIGFSYDTTPHIMMSIGEKLGEMGEWEKYLK